MQSRAWGLCRRSIATRGGIGRPLPGRANAEYMSACLEDRSSHFFSCRGAAGCMGRGRLGCRWGRIMNVQGGTKLTSVCPARRVDLAVFMFDFERGARLHLVAAHFASPLPDTASVERGIPSMSVCGIRSACVTSICRRWLHATRSARQLPSITWESLSGAALPPGVAIDDILVGRLTPHR